MYTDEQFEQLEQEERVITEEAIVAMILSIAATKGDLEKELRDFYAKYGKDGVVTYSDVRKWASEDDRRRRLTVLLLFIANSFDELHAILNPKFDSFLTNVLEEEMRFFDIDFDVEDVLNTRWGEDDAVWFARLADDVELFNLHVANDLKRAFLRHANIDEVLRQLDKRFTSIERIIQKLAMTESTAVGTLARREIFRELGVKKYKYYAREDERTCEVCGSLHGLTFPVSSYEIGVNASPMHPWCRCWEVPILD